MTPLWQTLVAGSLFRMVAGAVIYASFHSNNARAAGTWGEFVSPGADDPALIAPGRETPEVVAFLQRIADGRRQHDEALETLVFEGRTAFNTVAWSQGASDDTAASIEPQWFPFKVHQKGNRRHYEKQALIRSSSGDTVATVYRLQSDSASYVLNDFSLEISGLEHSETRWAHITTAANFYDLVHDGINMTPLLVNLRTYLDRLSDSPEDDYFVRKSRVLRCYEEDGLLVVDNTDAPVASKSPTGCRFTFWVDPNQGFQVVRSRYQLGAPGRDLFSLSETTSSFAEIAPDVFFVKRSISIFSTLGEVAKRDDFAGFGRRDLEITGVRFGDIAIDESLFDPLLLPVPEGAYVTDYRTEPHLSFRYGKEPLDEQLLAAAAGIRHQTPKSKFSRAFLVLNLIAIVAISCLLLKRYIDRIRASG